MLNKIQETVIFHVFWEEDREKRTISFKEPTHSVNIAETFFLYSQS